MTDLTDLDQVLLSVVRQTWPNLIANSIIGVQPMTGPTPKIFTLKARYSRNVEKFGFKMADKSYYYHFLRLNNRKKSIAADTIQAAGYPLIEFNHKQYKIRKQIFEWCEQTFPHGSWITDQYELIAFSNYDQAVMFKLAWSEEE